MSQSKQQRIEAKTLEGQLEYVLKNDFELSPRESQAIGQVVTEIFGLEHYNPSQHLTQGQIQRTVISKSAKHGPRLEDLPKVQVTLTKDKLREDKKLQREEGEQALRATKILRMADEAIEQGGTLSQEDLADILEVTVRTIRRDIRRMRENGFDVPTRGAYHDIGPGVSHKIKIVELYLEYNTYSDIQRKTRHSPASIKRYVTSFGRVVMAFKNGLSLKEVAHIVGISEKLAGEYYELLLKFNTEKYQDRLRDITYIAEKKDAAQAAAKRGVKNQ